MYNTTLNGTLLEEEIEGFVTVNIEGRGLFSKAASVIGIEGRPGGLVTQTEYPTRHIKVIFLLQAQNSESFLEKLQKLNEVLNDEEMVIEFGDEVGHRVGILESIQNPPVDSHAGIGSLTFACENPFLLGDVKTGSAVTSSTPYPVLIESIETTTTSAATKIILKNETKGTRIILDGTFPIGTKIKINLDKILINGENKTSLLDFVESDYQQFKVYNANVLSITPSSALTIKYREQTL